ncbi:hypothetical protein BKA83DRAFT_4127450 [Pisolithus microcarpus]|nr:hypothetical protein BKA83DRAFT_4127450 [Pisolithus microcarpus]
MTMTVSEEQITDQVVARLEGKVLGDLESHLTDRLKESVAVMASEEKIVERVLARLEEKPSHSDNHQELWLAQRIDMDGPQSMGVEEMNIVEVGDGLMGVEGKVYIILGMWVSSKELARKVEWGIDSIKASVHHLDSMNGGGASWRTDIACNGEDRMVRDLMERSDETV